MERKKLRIAINGGVIILSAAILYDTILGLNLFTDPELVNKPLILGISVTLFILSLLFFLIELSVIFWNRTLQINERRSRKKWD